jgi:methyl coenzyme M reductase subunit D
MNTFFKTLIATATVAAAFAAQADVVTLPRVVITGKATTEVVQLPRVVVTGHADRQIAQLPRVVIHGTRSTQVLAAAPAKTIRS